MPNPFAGIYSMNFTCSSHRISFNGIPSLATTRCNPTAESTEITRSGKDGLSCLQATKDENYLDANLMTDAAGQTPEEGYFRVAELIQHIAGRQLTEAARPAQQRFLFPKVRRSTGILERVEKPAAFVTHTICTSICKTNFQLQNRLRLVHTVR